MSTTTMSSGSIAPAAAAVDARTRSADPLDDILSRSTPPSVGQDPLAARWLPMLLRGAGALALGAALLVLLLRGWDGADNLNRYLMLLGLGTVLAISGLASGQWIGDGKGARLLVALSLASVPVNFAILGGFVLSSVDPGATGDGRLQWALNSGLQVLILMAVALPVLLAMTAIGMRVLLRPLARRQTLALLAACALLLLPSRAPVLVALLLLLALALRHWALAAVPGALRPTPSVRALSLLLLTPAVLLAGRNLWLYEVQGLLLTALLLGLYSVLRGSAASLPDQPARRVLEALALPLAVACGVAFGLALADTWPTLIRAPGSALLMPAGAGLSALLLFDQSRRGSPALASATQGLALLLLVGALLLNLLHGGLLPALLCMSGGLGLALHGLHSRQRQPLLAGALLLPAGLLHQALSLIGGFDWAHWTSLSALGLVAILLGSIIERHGHRLRQRFDGWRDELRSWER